MTAIFPVPQMANLTMSFMMDFLESIKNKWKNKLTLDMVSSQGTAEQKKQVMEMQFCL